MRRFIFGLVFSIWSTLACANVPCSLPFTLTNGTTADASQVMANYNALVACLANAAAAGTNTDITQLIGLTTPLALSGGGTPLYVGGTSAGSANAQTVATLSPNNFSLTPGFFAVFIAGFANTGAMTLSLNGTTPTNVTIQTGSGLSSLSGGELQPLQAKIVFYDGTQFQLVGGVAPSSLVPACTEISYQGVSTPSGYLAENGQAVSRSTFANLFACMSLTVSATLNGTTTITVPNSALFQVGWFVGGSNVTCNSTIQSIPGGGTSIVINNAAGASGPSTLTIGPQPQGDCSTTFNVPNANGRATVGIDTGGSTLSATACPNPASIGSKCGSTTQTILTANLPPYTPAGSVTLNTGGGSFVGLSGPSNQVASGSGFELISGSASFSGTPQGGTSTPFLLQPVELALKAIKF